MKNESGHYAIGGYAGEGDRLKVLESLYDLVSQRHLSSLGISEGWKCLEIGAGRGSVARWMSNVVGSTGRVTATDIDVGQLDDVPDNVVVVQHDLTADPLPEGEFDIVHARMVLEHLPEPTRLVGKLAIACKVGGWLVVEDVDKLASLTLAAGAALTRLRSAIASCVGSDGYQADLGRHLPGLLFQAGLRSVGAAGEVQFTTGCDGDAPTRQMYRHLAHQLADRMLSAQLLSAEELKSVLAELDGGYVNWVGSLFVSAWGQRIA